MVEYGHWLLSGALVGLVVVMTRAVLLIFDVALGLEGEAIAAASVLLVILLLAVLPARYARRH